MSSSGTKIQEIEEEDENENEEEKDFGSESSMNEEDYDQSPSIQLKLEISKELTKRVVHTGNQENPFQSPFVNAIISGNISILEHLITQGLSCPLKDLKISYSLAAGYHDEKTAETMLDIMQSAGKACVGDKTQSFPPCQGCREKMREQSTGKSRNFF